MIFDQEDTQFEDTDATEYDPYPFGALALRGSCRISRNIASARIAPPAPPKRRAAPPPFVPQARQLQTPIRNLLLPIPSVTHNERYLTTERVSKVSLSGFSLRSWAARLVAPIVAAAIVLGVVFGLALTAGGEPLPSSLPLALALPSSAPMPKIIVTAIAPESPAPLLPVPVIEAAKPHKVKVAKASRRKVAVDASSALGFLRPR